jgi:hypothetical protein
MYFGEMPERLNGAVSKTVDLVRDPGVRIPLSPPTPKPAERRFFSFTENRKQVFVFLAKEKKPDTKWPGFGVEAPLNGIMSESTGITILYPKESFFGFERIRLLLSSKSKYDFLMNDLFSVLTNQNSLRNCLHLLFH